MTCEVLELPKWNHVQQRDKLLGCSLTGWQDMVNAANLNIESQKTLLRQLKNAAKFAAESLAKKLGQNVPLLVTTLKPEGCWTSDHIRTLDDGIYFIDEINPNIEDNFGFTTLKDNSFSFNSNLISKTYKNDIKDGFKITLKNGRKLEITKKHPMSVSNKWVLAEDLKVNQILDFQLGSYRNLINQNLLNSNYPKTTNAIIEKTPATMNEDISWLIGAYFANGSLTTKHRIKFHCQYIEVHEKVQKIWKEYFNIETNIVKSSDRNSYTQDFANANIRSWLELNGLNKTEEFDRIPLVIRKSSYKTILAFIAGYADNDGCFSAKTFCIDSHNEVFIRHLQEVGEAVGLSFGVSINKARGEGSFSQNYMYKAHCSRAFSNEEAMNYINSISIKAKLKGYIEKGLVRSKSPYSIASIEEVKDIATYDIEVDNEHWYYQGALKSHNTISQMPTVSSGVHYSHSPYYIRRVRINSHDPLVKVCEELGYPIFPEVGQEIETCTTKVIEFPIKAPEGRTKYNVSAIEQLENYKLFMENYIDHNCSITVHVRNDEWDLVEQWIWENWDDVVAVSFLSLEDSFYQLLPYEACTKEQYEERKSKMKHFKPELLLKYEIFEESELDNSDCSTGVCPVR